MLRELASIRWSWLALAGLVALSVPRAATPPPEPPVEVVCTLVAADPRTEADELYRGGRSAQAAELLAGATDPELRTLAEMYAQFAVAHTIGVDHSQATTPRFEALRRAQTLDIALGGVFADRLYAEMRVVAPDAAALYNATGDDDSARLARQIAETYGSK